MIRPRYAVTLARTKLRSKRGILIASIIVASLLFAALIAFVILFTGVEKSAREYVKVSGNDRYLVKTSPVVPSSVLTFPFELNREQIEELRAFEAEYYASIREEYEAQGIEYDESSEVPILKAASWMPESVPEELRYNVDYPSAPAQALLEKKMQDYIASAQNKIGNLQEIGSRYGAQGYYSQQQSPLPALPSTRLIVDGKESFEQRDPSYEITRAVRTSSYSIASQQVLSRYMLDQTDKELKGIPVIITAQEAAKVFGETLEIGEEPETATDKTNWLREIQQKLNGHTYQACYRNEPEQAMLTKIERDYAEMQNNKDNSDYEAPGLQYDYSEEPCGDIVVVSDTRSSQEKAAVLAEEEAQKKLGTYIEPKHALLTFQVVGIMNYQQPTSLTASADAFIKNLLTPQDYTANTAIIPAELYQQLPEAMRLDQFTDAVKRHYGNSYAMISEDFAPRILEFSTIESAKAFIDTEGCSMTNPECDRLFYADPYGSNYLILDEIGKLFTKIAWIAFPVILGLATVIMWFTISRIMAENRKETAVYRAMGAKRSDITSIYVTYVMMVAGYIALLSTLIGVGLAFGLHYYYEPTLTSTAATSFGIIDKAPTFGLFDISSPILLIIIGSIFVTSLIASIQPLIRNVIRSPIRDMREE